MIIFYKNKKFYEEAITPMVCFEHGDRTMYELTDSSAEILMKIFDVNLYAEYGATYNTFADGTIALMTMEYNSLAEEYEEEFVKFLTPQEVAANNIVLKDRYDISGSTTIK